MSSHPDIHSEQCCLLFPRYARVGRLNNDVPASSSQYHAVDTALAKHAHAVSLFGCRAAVMRYIMSIFSCCDYQHASNCASCLQCPVLASEHFLSAVTLAFYAMQRNATHDHAGTYVHDTRLHLARYNILDSMQPQHAMRMEVLTGTCQ